MTPRCLSRLTPLAHEGYSPAALKRLCDRRKLPHHLLFSRSDIPKIRADQSARLSISGVQDKLSLRLFRGRLEPVTTGGQFILKPIPSTTLPKFHSDVPANEHLTMQLAEQVFGIRTAANGLVRLLDDELAYLTRRFDRTLAGDRFAQEDFCQLMNRSPDTHGPLYKYDSSYEALGATLTRYCAAYAVEVEELFLRLVFSYATCNGDGHLKNFSLRQGPRGDYLLTPAYDLLSSTLHLPTEPRLALELFDEGEVPDGVAKEGFETGRDFLELAKRFGMRPHRALAVVQRLARQRAMVVSLIGRSFLTEAAKRTYLRNYDDRLRALSM
ncbi:MAG: HipA domain-containing protein [Proteobacteria bacterium]|nr:HipA domain-containing protein [Pseudomonadota bacterium]